MAGVYVASVIVNDGKANSNAATVSVTASLANAAPVANAGVGQSVTAGGVVTLNGSASSDANGDALTYTWALMAKPAGSTATLTGANTAAPSFGADLAGTYVASLSVNDGKISSPASTVSIAAAAAANSVPVFSAMSSHNTNFGIDANGDLWGWGWNGHGELGNANTTDTLKPALLGHGYASISGSYGGESFTLAVKSDGTLLAWGINLFNTGGPDALTPQVIGTGGFASVSASTYFQAALKTDGSLWTWGRNDSGLAGDGSTVPIPAPKQIGTNFATVSAGAIHAMAVKKDGSLWAWGSGTCGALATNQNQNLNVPTQIGVGYRDALAMSGYATIALKTDGTLWSWGGTYNGVLGDGVGAANCRNTPLQIGSGFTAIARGYSYAIALKADGSVWSWGHLSISTRDTGADSLIPRQIGTGFVKIFMGSWRAYAVSADGGLWAWGDSHDYGFANTMGYSAVPVRVN